MAKIPFWQRFQAALSFKQDYSFKPYGIKWRSSTVFILATVGIGIFSDLFLYTSIVPILPFILEDRLGIPYDEIQGNTSALLAVFATSTVLLCPIAGAISDRIDSRQLPFLGGIFTLILSTLLFFLGRNMPLLVLARIFQGASSAFVWTVGLTLALDTVGSKNLGKAIGSLLTFATLGEMCAPVIAGAMYRHLGIYSVLALSLSILVIDLVMRLLVIEKKHAARYDAAEGQEAPHRPVLPARDSSNDTSEDIENSAETTRLLPSADIKPADSDDDEYYIPSDQPALIRAAPILYPLMHSPALAMAYFTNFAQQFILTAYNATVPTHARDLYDFDSSQVGLLFLPLSLVNLVVGPLGGWAIDRWGTKFCCVFAYGWLMPCLILLRLPQATPFPEQVFLWGTLLGLMGVGISVAGSPGIVEAGIVLEKYYIRNPDFFGTYGPYAQLYSVMSIAFNLGGALGPVAGGALKDRIGYGDMNIFMAAICGLTAVLAFFWLGGSPSRLWRKKV